MAIRPPFIKKQYWEVCLSSQTSLGFRQRRSLASLVEAEPGSEMRLRAGNGEQSLQPSGPPGCRLANNYSQRWRVPIFGIKVSKSMRKAFKSRQKKNPKTWKHSHNRVSKTKKLPHSFCCLSQGQATAACRCDLAPRPLLSIKLY